MSRGGALAGRSAGDADRLPASPSPHRPARQPGAGARRADISNGANSIDVKQDVCCSAFFSSCSPPDHQVVHRINFGVGPNARWALIDLVDWSTIHLGLFCALDDKVGLITTNWTTRYNSKMSVTFCAT